MPKLIKPEPADYGLTEDSYKRLKTNLPRIEKLVILYLPCLIWTFVFIGSLQVVRGSVGSFIGIIGGGIITFISSKVFRAILYNLPFFRKIRAYELAAARYVQQQSRNGKTHN